MDYSNYILKTKLFLPLPITDFVGRQNIDEKLNRLEHIPVLLVSAATGYGKSTIVAEWLRKQICDYGWISLSDQDNNFEQFILYFRHAIEQKISGFDKQMIELDKSQKKLTAHAVADYFMNALAELDRRFILVLDDYHVIRNVEVHQFISRLFTYPQPHFRLIICSRQDPALPLSQWRMKNLLVEVRANDLKFNHAEIRSFISKIWSDLPEEGLVDALENISEGWITGLRLMVLSVDNVDELAGRYANQTANEMDVFDNLVIEILNRQSRLYRECLLKLSLLYEFDEVLFNRVCNPEYKGKSEGSTFAGFTDMLVNSNLFLIPLDKNLNWFRFHHLVADILNRIAEQELSQETRILVFKTAANYVIENQYSIQGIEYFIKAGMNSEAISVFKAIRMEKLSEARWPVLNQIFAHFPENVVNQSALLSLTRGWLHIYRGNIPEMIANIDPSRQLILSEKMEGKERDNLLGELEVMSAFSRYNFDIDMNLCLKHSRTALKKLDASNTYPLGLSWIFYGGAMQTLNNSSEAKEEIHRIIYAGNPGLMPNLFLTLCYIDWLDGNLATLRRTAMQLVTLGEKQNNKEALANGWYFIGMALYFEGKDQEALKAFRNVHDLGKYTLRVHHFFGTVGLAKLLAELGSIEEAEVLFEELENSSRDLGGPIYVQMARAFIADFQYLRRAKTSGLKWAKETDDLLLVPMTNFTSPQMSRIRILVQDNDPESWKQARKILDEVIPFLESYNNVNYQVRALALFALVSYKQGEHTTAMDTLNRVLGLAEPRGFVRPFISLGSQMAELLEELKRTNKYEQYIMRLLQQMNVNESAQNQTLSSRESQILELLGSQLTNKEVGDQLFISEATVKRHIANIFKKLKASNRKEALSKARKLELI